MVSDVPEKKDSTGEPSAKKQKKDDISDWKGEWKVVNSCRNKSLHYCLNRVKSAKVKFVEVKLTFNWK